MNRAKLVVALQLRVDHTLGRCRFGRREPHFKLRLPGQWSVMFGTFAAYDVSITNLNRLSGFTADLTATSAAAAGIICGFGSTTENPGLALHQIGCFEKTVHFIRNL